MIPFNRRLYTFGIKTEATIGTKATIAAADSALRVMNPKILPIGSSALIPAGTGLADLGAVVGAYSGALSFDMELYNNSSIWPSRVMPSCGFALTATANTYQICDVVSTGATSNAWQTVTSGLWWNTAGNQIQYGCYGAMGTVGFRLTAGMPIMGSFKYAGVYTSSPGSLPTGITYESTLPPLFNSFTVDGASGLSIPSLTVESDDYVGLIPIPNTAGCVRNAWARKQNWRVKFDPLQDTTDWVADWITNGTGHTFSAVAGVTSGNIITLSGTMVQVTAPGKDERDENLVTPMEFAILGNSLTVAFS